MIPGPLIDEIIIPANESTGYHSWILCVDYDICSFTAYIWFVESLFTRFSLIFSKKLAMSSFGSPVSAWAILEALLNCLLLMNSRFLNYNGGCMIGGIN